MNVIKQITVGGETYDINDPRVDEINGGKLYMHRISLYIDPEITGDYANHFSVHMVVLSSDPTPLTDISNQTTLYTNLLNHSVCGITKFVGKYMQGPNIFTGLSYVVIEGDTYENVVDIWRVSAKTIVRYIDGSGTEKNKSFDTSLVDGSSTVSEV